MFNAGQQADRPERVEFNRQEQVAEEIVGARRLPANPTAKCPTNPAAL